jgi:hypothetical protein
MGPSFSELSGGNFGGNSGGELNSVVIKTKYAKDRGRIHMVVRGNGSANSVGNTSSPSGNQHSPEYNDDSTPVLCWT